MADPASTATTVEKLSDWNTLLDRVNAKLAACGITPLSHVTAPHLWSVTDITAVQNLLRASCPGATFATLGNLWKQSTIDEINAALNLTCCAAGSGCLEYGAQMLVTTHYTPSILGLSSTAAATKTAAVAALISSFGSTPVNGWGYYCGGNGTRASYALTSASSLYDILNAYAAPGILSYTIDGLASNCQLFSNYTVPPDSPQTVTYTYNVTAGSGYLGNATGTYTRNFPTFRGLIDYLSWVGGAPPTPGPNSGTWFTGFLPKLATDLAALAYTPTGPGGSLVQVAGGTGNFTGPNVVGTYNISGNNTFNVVMQP